MRPPTHIPDDIEVPFPIEYDSKVVCGFGRGSAELGIPTANVPINSTLNSLDPGIYFGVCKLSCDEDGEAHPMDFPNERNVSFNYGRSLLEEDLKTKPMVMSIGWNPYYNNTEKAAEVHIIHKFENDFYGAKIKISILGYIRPELNYTTKDALIEDIEKDIECARRALTLPQYKIYLNQE